MKYILSLINYNKSFINNLTSFNVSYRLKSNTSNFGKILNKKDLKVSRIIITAINEIIITIKKTRISNVKFDFGLYFIISEPLIQFFFL